MWITASIVPSERDWTVMALDDLEKLFYRVFMSVLGYDPDAAYQRPPVRRSWSTMGQPDWNFEEDVLFFQLTFLDGQDVSQPLHEFWLDDGAKDLIRHQEQTRVMQAQLIAYGPNGATNLDNIRTAIYNGIPLLRANDIYVVPGNEAPKYAPELFQAQWWRRADMTMMFNVGKSYDTHVLTVETVNITVKANRPAGSTEVVTDGITVVKE